MSTECLILDSTAFFHDGRRYHIETSSFINFIATLLYGASM